jgi:hypothetical protein|tara:strand:- start:6034 stop:6426 length:393 start_codon:yes stop_codon:yes gene_type:complete
MARCFICRLFGKNALATCSSYIDHTANIVKERIKSETVKTYLFGWIRIVEDRVFNEHSHTENNGHKPVCNKCKYVESVTTYPDKKPEVVERDISTMRDELVHYLSDVELEELNDSIKEFMKEKFEVFEYN